MFPGSPIPSVPQCLSGMPSLPGFPDTPVVPPDVNHRCTIQVPNVESPEATDHLPNTQDEARDPLHLERCPDCGYLLTGLPEQGICPECGFASTPAMIVLYGWGSGPHRIAANMRMHPVEWAITRALIVILVALMACIELNSLPAMAIAGLLAVAYVAYTGYQRWHASGEAPAPVQLRLFPAGFAQRNGIGPVRKLRAWSGKRVYIRRLGNGRYHIRCWKSLQWETARGSSAIDFERDCDDATASLIAKRVGDWCSCSLTY